MAWDAVGPMAVVSGDPTVAAGASMTQWRKVRQVSLDLNIQQAWTSTDAQNGVPFADGLYTLAVQPAAQVGVMDFDTDQATLLVLNSTLNVGSVGFPTAFTQVPVASVPTVAFIPSGEKAAGVSAAHGFWFTRASYAGPAGMNFGRITAGEIDNPSTMTVNAAYSAVDQLTPTPTAIDEKWRIAFFGPPADSPVALPWSLPALN